MEDYTKYSVEDLLQDEGFLNYCRSANQADAESWEKFLAEHPAMVPVALEAKRLFHIMSITVADTEKQVGIDKLEAVIQSGKQEPAIPSKHRIGWIRWAAAAAAIILVSSALFIYLRPGTEKRIALADYHKAAFTQKIYTSGEQRQKITLPDGSVAELNYGSTLKLANDYGQTNRWIYLEGEAFFSVEKDAEKPFVVITKQTATTALGTSFKVKAYADQASGNVMLASGKVKVETLAAAGQQEKIILVPGEEAIWGDHHPVTSSSFDLSLITAWREQQVVFDKTDLKGIIKTLEFYYGVTIKLENDPTAAIAFTGRFTQKTLKDVLEAISFANKFNYVREGNIVSIRFE